MKILMIYSQLSTGGIETLLVRMANWFVEHGDDVTLFLTYKTGELVEELDKRVKVFCPKENIFGSLGRLGYFLRSIPDLARYTYDLIYTFQPEGLLISYCFRTRKRLMGIYHQETFAKTWRKITVNEIEKIDPNWTKKIAFPSESSKLFSEYYLGKELSGILFPIPISFPKFKDFKLNNSIANKNTRKIVSIGRLVDFKTYNFYMLDVVQELLKVYRDVTYHIYGFGPNEIKLKQLISEKGLKDVVFFHGLAKHSEYHSYLENATVFVGMGVSMLEASYFGVPAIVAVNRDIEAKTYGFFHELNGYELAESIFNKSPEIPVKEKIIELFEMSDEDYKKECEKARKKALEYDEERVFSNFLKDLENIPEENRDFCIDLKKLLSVKFKQKISNTIYKIKHTQK